MAQSYFDGLVIALRPVGITGLFLFKYVALNTVRRSLAVQYGTYLNWRAAVFNWSVPGDFGAVLGHFADSRFVWGTRRN